MYNTKFCKITHLTERQAILCEWKQFCKNDDYRNPLIYGQELINEHNIDTWITDTTNGFESAEADTKWLLEEFVPQIIASSVETIIFIMKKDSPLQSEIEGQVVALSEFFDVRVVEEKIHFYDDLKTRRV